MNEKLSLDWGLTREATRRLQATKLELVKAYKEGDYELVVDTVDKIYGWRKGELPDRYVKEVAEWCLNQL